MDGRVKVILFTVIYVCLYDIFILDKLLHLLQVHKVLHFFTLAFCPPLIISLLPLSTFTSYHIAQIFLETPLALFLLFLSFI